MGGWEGRSFSGRYMQSHEGEEAVNTGGSVGAKRENAYYNPTQ